MLASPSYTLPFPDLVPHRFPPELCGDLDGRWAGSWGIKADFIAKTMCSVIYISAEELRVRVAAHGTHLFLGSQACWQGWREVGWGSCDASITSGADSDTRCRAKQSPLAARAAALAGHSARPSLRDRFPPRVSGGSAG